jgi:hypothetical protein
MFLLHTYHSYHVCIVVGSCDNVLFQVLTLLRAWFAARKYELECEEWVRGRVRFTAEY